jgi:hypothetical protein
MDVSGYGVRCIEYIHLLLQCASMTALHAATHLSTNASINSPMQVPTIAPALFGTHPKNKTLSPDVK